MAVPFPSSVGAAAFRRGSDAVVVFDTRKPIDLLALKDDPVFGSAAVQLLPAATVIRLRLPEAAELRLDRKDLSWEITAIGGTAVPPALHPIEPEQDGEDVALRAMQAGTVVSVPDPATGGVLMIGTQRGAGEGVVASRHTPDLVLHPSWQGVVIEPLSDTVSLRATAKGFLIHVEADGRSFISSALSPGTAEAAAASRMTRVFDFPNLPIDRLNRRLQSAIVAASAAPVQSRAPARQAVAESMVALGLGPEAQAVLSLAASGDARSADDPKARALSAIAALISGRVGETDALADPRLDGTDDIAFWRAIRTAMAREGAPEAAEAFASRLPLVMSYPAELRARVLPLVAETLALGGQPDAARRLGALNTGDPSLDFARAILRQSEGGDPDETLAQLDRLAQAPDRLLRLRASVRAAELRHDIGRATAAETATTLAKLLFAWRGDDREIDLRLRVAELQADAGQWRASLQMLRETDKTWPEHNDVVGARLRSTFERSISPDAERGLKPFDLVALAEENADLMPSGEIGRRLAERVSDQLVELDLPGRTVPFFEHMVATSPAGLARATYGERLADLKLRQGNPAAAIDALSATVSDTLPPPLLESRTLTFARAVAAQGDFASAEHALNDLDTPAAGEAMASLAETAHRWPVAVAALLRAVDRDLPPSGKLDEVQGRQLVRLAGAASQAGDEATLARLRTQFLPRVSEGKTADLLRLLTTQPVAGVSDLTRSAHDVALVSALPRALAPIASR